jgi:predicted MPP superfamily phosphohydrolase
MVAGDGGIIQGMDTTETPPTSLRVTRRRFLRQSFVFSAAAAIQPLSGLAAGMLKPNPHAAHALMIGDWGDDKRRDAQSAVAQAMGAYTRQWRLKHDALILLGDNFYGEFPGGLDCPRFKTDFEEMYPKTVFDCPAYAVPGNHDYEARPELKLKSQLEYAARGNTRWTEPAQWYSYKFPLHKPVATVIALDSNMPFPDGKPAHGYTHVMTEEQRQQQLVWLRSELAKPLTTPFRIVIAHHPVYSNGPHGDHKILIADWEPLLREYKVHLYLAGHDHDLQHLEFAGHPTSFFLSGGGGADLYDERQEVTQRGPFFNKVQGFSHLEATEKLLTLRHVDTQGNVMHGFTKSVDGTVSILS